MKNKTHGLIFAVIISCLVPLGAPANAQSFRALKSLGYAQMTSLASAASLPSIPAGTVEAFVICTGQTVYWRDDGTSPTSSVGMPLPVNTAFPYTGSLVAIKFIQSSASATCNVTYYGS